LTWTSGVHRGYLPNARSLEVTQFFFRMVWILKKAHKFVIFYNNIFPGDGKSESFVPSPYLRRVTTDRADNPAGGGRVAETTDPTGGGVREGTPPPAPSTPRGPAADSLAMADAATRGSAIPLPMPPPSDGTRATRRVRSVGDPAPGRPVSAPVHELSASIGSGRATRPNTRHPPSPPPSPHP